MITSPGISIVHTDRLELTFSPKPWAFAIERRAEIDAHFAALKRDKPALWNGRVLLLHDHAIADDVFRGFYLESDFASYIAWRDWGFPAAKVKDCFGAAAIMTADGGYLLGVMGAHTANAGRIYFPSGTPDPGDVVDGQVDLEHSMRRELREETGLDAGEFQAAPGWTTLLAGPLIVQIRQLHARQDATVLRQRVLEHLARENQPELADIRIVRGPADLDPMMPPFVAAFLRHVWR